MDIGIGNIGNEEECSLARLPSALPKCAPGLGRLNRLIAKSTKAVVKMNHVNKRFKRDYTTGIAFYQCPVCQATAAVGLGQGRGETFTSGDAFETLCNPSK